jgi:hypothetical protein
MPGACSLLALALRCLSICAIAKVSTGCTGNVEKVGFDRNLVFLAPVDQRLVEVSDTSYVVNVSLMEKLFKSNDHVKPAAELISTPLLQPFRSAPALPQSAKDC